MGQEAVETDGHSGDDQLACVNREQPQETEQNGETGQPSPQQPPLHSIQVVDEGRLLAKLTSDTVSITAVSVVFFLMSDF